jgi:hypothetical protein
MLRTPLTAMVTRAIHRCSLSATAFVCGEWSRAFQAIPILISAVRSSQGVNSIYLPPTEGFRGFSAEFMRMGL